MQGNDFIPDLQTLARALGGVVSNGQVLAPGPGHSTADRSLAIRPDPNAPNGFLVHSFSGDDPVQCRDFVREKCGLPAFKPNGRKRASSDEIAAMVAGAVASQRWEKPKRPSAVYPYVDGNGTVLYQVLRYDNPKTFRQRRPDGNGGWTWNLNGARRVLYRLPDLLEYPDATVFVCEGEKDADRVASLGHCATTVASGRWEGVDVAPLKDRDCIILQDMDIAGEKKALAAAHALHGTAKTIRIVRLPGLTGHPANKDVSDWLDTNLNRAEKFVDICFDAPIWTPDAATEDATVTETVAEPKASATTAKEETPPLPFLNLAEWQHSPAPERQWCVLNRIPLNNVTLLSGEGSVGKTILSLHLAVAVVLGRDWTGTMPEMGPALAVCCEDDGDELHRRLDAILKHYAAGFADLKDMHLLSLAGQDALMAVPNRHGLMAPTKLFARVTEAARDIKPKLIVLDNSADVFGGGRTTAHKCASS